VLRERAESQSTICRLEGNQRNKIETREAEAQIAQVDSSKVEGKEEVGSAATGRPRADSIVWFMHRHLAHVDFLLIRGRPTLRPPLLDARRFRHQRISQDYHSRRVHQHWLQVAASAPCACLEP
jgi:hypothetical protein